MPMDSAPYEHLRQEMEGLLEPWQADLHVVKVAGKLEGIRKLKHHLGNQSSCAKLFFARMLSKDNASESLAIQRHTNKTGPEQIRDMYLLFQPRCVRRPSLMKELPHLDLASFREPIEVIAAKLWHLPMELQGDCIVSGVSPDDAQHPMHQHLDLSHMTQHYQWGNKGWSNKLQRVRRSRKGADPQAVDMEAWAAFAEWSWWHQQGNHCAMPYVSNDCGMGWPELLGGGYGALKDRSDEIVGADSPRKVQLREAISEPVEELTQLVEQEDRPYRPQKPFNGAIAAPKCLSVGFQQVEQGLPDMPCLLGQNGQL